MKEKNLILVFLAFPFYFANAKTAGSVEEWWQGKKATGDWFGARTTLEDRGVDFSGRWSAVYASVVSGGLQRRSSFVEQLRFEPDLDFAKLTGWATFEGLTLTARVHWRDGCSLINSPVRPIRSVPSLFEAGMGGASCPFI